MEGILVEIENMIARGRMDLPLTLCFAALRGDDLLLNHLLKRGVDPNESDNNGRTALVSIFLFYRTSFTDSSWPLKHFVRFSILQQLKGMRIVWFSCLMLGLIPIAEVIIFFHYNSCC